MMRDPYLYPDSDVLRKNKMERDSVREDCK